MKRRKTGADFIFEGFRLACIAQNDMTDSEVVSTATKFYATLCLRSVPTIWSTLWDPKYANDA